MHLRISRDFLIPAVLVVGSVLLAASAWFAFGSIRSVLDSGERIARLRDAELQLATLRLSAGAPDLSATPLGDETGAIERPRTTAQNVARQLAEIRRRLAEDAAPDRDSGISPAGLRQNLAAQRHAGTPATPTRPDQGTPADMGDANPGHVSRIAVETALLHETMVAQLDAATSEAIGLRADAVRRTVLLAVLVVVFIVAGAMLLLREARERRRLQRQFADAAHHDPLTGLPGRRFLDVWLGYALAQARRDDAHVGLLWIGLDGLPDVADPHGRRERDRVLAETAHRFRATARDADVLVRQGNDGFVLAVPGIRDGHAIEALARRLIVALRDPERPPIADVTVGASIGVAFFPHDAGDVAGLLAAAADAMYVARRGGRNRAVFSAVAAFA